MYKFKKVLCLLLMLIMSITLLTSCQSTQTTAPDNSTGQQEPVNEASMKNLNSLLKPVHTRKRYMGIFLI